MTRPTPIIAGTLAVLLLLFGAYMGAYYAMLKGGSYVFSTRQPLYRMEGDFVAQCFAPAHALDRLMRQVYWSEPRWGPTPPLSPHLKDLLES